MTPGAVNRSRLVRAAFALVAVAVLGAGIVAYGRGRSADVVPASSSQPAAMRQAAQGEPDYGKRIALPRAALATSREFVATAVLRTHLGRAWDLAAPSLKRGLTRSEWLTGTIPVVPFPARAFGHASFKVVRSQVRDVLLAVLVVSKNPAVARTQDFFLELVPFQKRWLVSYWAPKGHIGALPAIP
jgi:hypothetical protein